MKRLSRTIVSIILVLASIQSAFAAEAIVIVASGQSNVLGRISEGPFVHNENLYVYNNDWNQFEVADLQHKSYRTVLGDSFGGGKANAAIAFANRIQHEKRVPVYVVIEGKGGASIENWVTGDYTAKVNKVVDQAIASEPGLSRDNVQYFVWLQGEVDLRTGMDETEYAQAFYQVANQIGAPMTVTAPISQGYIDNNVGHDNLGVQDFFHSLGRPYRVANVDGLTLGDTAHYDGRSVWELGYFRLYEALPH
ncbi:sialate O-acetylesterase [Hahella sp. NBU794]|uniref:sialate O-acetylesterase n=1 Tax=Hahella sp. NBU794 TaxID=3422590 RepID=UPI003D70164E